MDDTTKKLIWFNPAQAEAVEAYARENGLMYGGKPHFSAAVRQLINRGLGLPEESHELKAGPPFKNPPGEVDTT